MTSYFLILFAITFCAIIGWLILVNRFSRLLKLKYPAIHESLGSPMTSFLDVFRNKPQVGLGSISFTTTSEQNAAIRKLVSYILFGKFYATQDRDIIRLGRFMRCYFMLVIAMMVLLVVFGINL